MRQKLQTVTEVILSLSSKIHTDKYCKVIGGFYSLSKLGSVAFGCF